MTEEERRSRLLEIVRRLKAVTDPQAEYDRLVSEYGRLARYPGAADLVFHEDLHPEEIVRRILSHQPMQLPPPDDPLAAAHLGDSAISSIEWTSEDDVAIAFQRTDGSCVVASFVFASGVRISMDYGAYGGRPLVFDARAELLPGNRWSVRVRLGAAPEGTVTLECNQLRIDARN